MIADHRRNLGRIGKRETLPILQICPPSSQTIGDIFDLEFLLVGKIWDSQETVKSPIVWDFRDIWEPGFRLKVNISRSADEITQDSRQQPRSQVLSPTLRSDQTAHVVVLVLYIFWVSKVSQSVRFTFDQPPDLSFSLWSLFSFREGLVHCARQI